VLFCILSLFQALDGDISALQRAFDSRQRGRKAGGKPTGQGHAAKGPRSRRSDLTAVGSGEVAGGYPGGGGGGGSKRRPTGHSASILEIAAAAMWAHKAAIDAGRPTPADLFPPQVTAGSGGATGTTRARALSQSALSDAQRSRGYSVASQASFASQSSALTSDCSLGGSLQHFEGGGGGGGDGGGGDGEEVFYPCRRGAFGSMVGCDGEACRFEWFHYAFVGVTEQPTGTWLCQECAEAAALSSLSSASASG